MSNLRTVSGRGNRRGLALSAALGLLVLAGLAPAQPTLQDEDAPKPPPIFKPGSAEHEEQAKIELVPGALPEDAKPEAVALWMKAVAATRTKLENGEVAVPGPVDSFRLTFDLRWKNGTQTNDIPEAQLDYLSPGYVRTTLGSGRQLLRGPEGDYLVDRGKADRLGGRESAQDRKQLDDTTRLAKNFLSLTNPGSLRIRRLEKTTAPSGLPRSHADDAKKLDWILVESPDFYLLQPDASGRPPFDLSSSTKMYSARLGVEKATGHIRQAEIVHQRATGEWKQSPLFISFDKFFSRDGFELPGHMFVYDVEQGISRRDKIYRKTASSSLYLKQKIENGISLRPGLNPQDFLPPSSEGSKTE